MAAACLITTAGHSDDLGDLPARLRELRDVRRFEARVSLAVEYRACRPRSPESGVDCATTSPLASLEVLRLAAAAQAALDQGTAPEALHVLGLLDLLSSPVGIVLDRSIQSLSAAATLSQGSASSAAYADLAAAYLVRAQRSGERRDLLQAIEASARAVEADSTGVAGRFNLALALEHAGLMAESMRAWRAYLVVDSSSRWAAEARRRLEDLARDTVTTPPPQSGAPPAAYERFAGRAPQQAQLLGWRLLGEWGAKDLAGDPARAARSLAAAQAIGRILAEKGRARGLQDEAALIGAAATETKRVLARAHRDYVTAQASYAATTYQRAESEFEGVAALAGEDTPLGRWARLFAAASGVYQGRVAAGEKRIRLLAAGADTVADPSFAGRAEWFLGTTLLRTSRYLEAASAYDRAARLLSRAGEDEHVGAVVVMAGQAWLNAGEDARADECFQTAVSGLRRFRRSIWLHNALIASMRSAHAAGLSRAAELAAAEDIAVTAALPSLYQSEARLERAHLRAPAPEGDVHSSADLAEIRGMLERAPVGPGRAWQLADLQVLEASRRLSAAPAAATAALDSAVAFYGAIHDPLRLVPALVARAEARAAARAPGFDRDLQRAVALLDTVRSYARDPARRGALARTVREYYARAALHALAGGDTAGGLIALERGRALRLEGARRERPEAPLMRGMQGSAALDLMLVGDTLTTWVVGDRVSARRTRVAADAMRRTVDRLAISLAMSIDSAWATETLADLYDQLVRPQQERLGPAGSPLTIVADGDLARVPFAALYDRLRRRYLVELYRIRFSPGLLDTPRPAGKRGGGALIVGDPAFEPGGAGGFTRLPGARAEADAVAREYTGARELTDSAATREAFLRLLRSADVIHFAGHAVFDERRPDESYLLLASSRPDRRDGRLTAADIQRLDLAGVRLVVLSGCETSAVQGPRGDAFLGLTGAFLTAGAAGVVGSLWRVDDDATRALMLAFHRSYRGGAGGARALASAQIALIRSADPRLRRPSSWAAFRYIGE